MGQKLTESTYHEKGYCPTTTRITMWLFETSDEKSKDYGRVRY